MDLEFVNNCLKETGEVRIAPLRGSRIIIIRKIEANLSLEKSKFEIVYFQDKQSYSLNKVLEEKKINYTNLVESIESFVPFLAFTDK